MSPGEKGEKSAQIKQRLQDKTVQNSSKQICGWISMWETTADYALLCVIKDATPKSSHILV